MWLDKQNNNFARAARFLYISLPPSHDYNVKLLNFTFYREREDKTTTFLFFPRTLIQPLEFMINSKPFANIWRIKWDGISAIKFEAARIHFLSDVFVRSRRRRCGLNSILCLSKSGEKGGFSHPLLPFPPPPPSFSGSTSVQLLRGCISYFTSHKRKKTPKKTASDAD